PGRIDGLDDALHCGVLLHVVNGTADAHRVPWTGADRRSARCTMLWRSEPCYPPRTGRAKPSGHPDLNRGPSAPKADALPSCAMPRRGLHTRPPGKDTPITAKCAKPIRRRAPGVEHDKNFVITSYQAGDPAIPCMRAQPGVTGTRSPDWTRGSR